MSALAAATRAVVGLSAALARRDADALEAALDVAARDATSVGVEEALLQSYLFLGYPAALNGLARWRRRAPEPALPPAADDPAGWVLRGEAVCERVYAGQYPRLRDNIRALHPDMERWMVVEGYGKVLGRPGLPLAVRELCIIAILAWQDAAPQLHAHLRGALNAGASEAEVDDAIAIAREGLDPAAAEAATAVWQEVRGRWREKRAP